MRSIDQKDRKNRVLAAAVSSYINTGHPVSSQELAQAFELSSATIRNILAELEEEGYLVAPHTSAGRVPSDKGYRYYVDFLMSGTQLDEQCKARVGSVYASHPASFEEVLETTTDILADLTHYTAIVSFAEWEDRIFYKGLSNIFQHQEFHDWQKLAILVRLLEEKKQILQILNQRLAEPLQIYIGEEIECPTIRDVCSLVVTSYQRGKKNAGKIAVLGPRRMSYDKAVSALEFISHELNVILEGF